MQFRMSDVAAITDGVLLGPDLVVEGASIDSRSIPNGSLFVPIVAERDGHDYIDAAMAGGAAGHLTSEASSTYPAVRVADTSVALQQLGLAARERVSGDVIGVTGSVGKTTTKDLLAACLRTTKVTQASYRSFNNELGVPLTLLGAPDGVEVVVTEMGARGGGHISDLCDIAQPTIGVVLTVGAAHTELFGDLRRVAEAKGELVEALPASGTAVLNADDKLVAAMAARTSAHLLLFGRTGDVRADDIRLDELLRPTFQLRSPWGDAPCRLASAGVHTVTNALAAAATALQVGVPIEAVVDGLAGAEISPWRMEVVRLSSGATVVNDAYNANPLSMDAAIDAVVALPAERRVAVVGVMAELGDRHEGDHRSVGERLQREGIEVISMQVPEYGGTVVTTVDAALAALGKLDAETVVLVKGSRVAALERVVDALRAD